MNRSTICTGIGLVALFCAFTPVIAANKPKHDAAQTAVNEVLQSEAKSSSSEVDRRAALQPASRSANDPNSVWWQAGYLNSGSQWLPLEQSVVEGADAAKLNEYAALRAELESTANGPWKLAQWCRKNHLPDQERVHLLQVLAQKDGEKLAVNDQTISRDVLYERLGCQKIGDEWVSPQSRREATTSRGEVEQSYKRWHAKLESLAPKFDGPPKAVALADKQLSEITSPSVVPMIVSVLCLHSPSAAEHGIQALSQIRGYQASRALAGQAVFSPYRNVRLKAIDLLKQRDVEHYAPDLLLLMAKPIRTTVRSDEQANDATKFKNWSWSATTSGFNCDYIWVDESQDKVQVGIHRLFPFWLPEGTYREVSQRHPWTQGFYDQSGRRQDLDAMVSVIREGMRQEKEALDTTAETINEKRAAVNRRVGKVLSAVTDQPMSAEPQAWWDWWTTYSNVESPGQKQVIIAEKQQPLQLIPTIRRSCLVAGTPVWTEKGFIAIEKIRVGDRVLAKDITTGELAYKPVLKTTEREPTPVHNFTVNDETITSSLGHHFWVSGNGWTKTRELAANQPLHTATGTKRIASIEDEGKSEKVYNLVVADFHTYFVGKSMILSHDVMTPALTDVKVPGLPVE